MQDIDDLYNCVHRATQQWVERITEKVHIPFVVHGQDPATNIDLYQQLAPLFRNFYLQAGLGAQPAEGVIDFVGNEYFNKWHEHCYRAAMPMMTSSGDAVQDVWSDYQKLLSAEQEFKKSTLRSSMIGASTAERLAISEERKKYHSASKDTQQFVREHLISWEAWVAQGVLPILNEMVEKALGCAHAVTGEVTVEVAPLSSATFKSAESAENPASPQVGKTALAR